MIVRPRKSRADQKPMVILLCDDTDPADRSLSCMERELFPYGTDAQTISNWIKRSDWTVIYRGHGKFHHRCSRCERLSKAPASYWERLAS